MRPIEKSYYVDLPRDAAEEHWRSFEHELSYPGADLDVRFDPVAGAPRRCRVTSFAFSSDAARHADDRMRRFRLFLQRRGLVR